MEEAIRKLRLGTSTGTDNICGEILKHIGDAGLTELTHLCNETYNTGRIPKDLIRKKFIALPKKRGQ